MKYLVKFITFLFVKLVITKHKFLPSILIKRKRFDKTTPIYEVEANYFTKQFEVVHIVRDSKGNIFSITGIEINEFIEHQSMSEEKLEVT